MDFTCAGGGREGGCGEGEGDGEGDGEEECTGDSASGSCILTGLLSFRFCLFFVPGEGEGSLVMMFWDHSAPGVATVCRVPSSHEVKLRGGGRGDGV